MDKKLPILDLNMKNYVSLIDEKLQFAVENGVKSQRHRIINNLPGTPNFCPIVRKTPLLERYIAENLSAQKNEYLQGIRKRVLQRASAFCF